VSAAFDVKLEGGDELIAALRRMDVNVKAELRAAVSAGAVIVRDAARGLAPGPEIETAVVRATASVVEVDIGPTKEKWHYKFFETGAAAHEIRGKALLAFEGSNGLVVTPGVSHPGMGASPFLRPAMDANESAATDAIGAKLRTSIEAAGS
jgi:HK97 gp10 family phage protein